MKRKVHKILGITVILFVAASAGVFAQDFNMDNMSEGYKDFSSELATSLPFASTTGLNWSDARVRGFPHFGAGVSFGVTMMPGSAFNDLAESIGVKDDLPSKLLGSLGLPLPGYTIDGRIGIPVLPIDVGAKFGTITPDMASTVGLNANYTLAGFDVRYGIIGGNVALPAITASAGYNYLSGGVATELDGDALGTSISTEAGDITYSDPELSFAWKSSNLDFKLQASKGLLIFTPTVGLGYTHGWSEAGGGITAEITDYPSNLSDYYSDLEIDDKGFEIIASDNGGAFRVFGGVQFNLAIFKLDFNGRYNITTKSWGGGINARVQI